MQATKSGKRLGKDPMRPKKPKTAYLFYADKVSSVRAERPLAR